MKIHFVDTNELLIQEWTRAFDGLNDVSISHGSILDYPASALVSPANSYGFMDGGIDKEYLRYFGYSIQDKVKDLVCSREQQMIPVGAAECVKTGDLDFPLLIIAPTMISPEAVSAMNAYRAFRAILRLTSSHELIDEIACPGLCTGVGEVSPSEAADMMREAYNDWLKWNEQSK